MSIKLKRSLVKDVKLQPLTNQELLKALVWQPKAYFQQKSLTRERFNFLLRIQ